MARRKAKEATVPYLRRIALWYLERYGGTMSRVRGALERRVRRSVNELGTDAEAGAEAIEVVLGELVELGLIDDARFAESRVRTLRRRGKSARAIVSTVGRQGVASAAIAGALEKADEDGQDELAAARTFARKRRLGPHRKPGAENERERDLVKLARAGFSFDTARRVVDESLEESLGDQDLP